MTGRDDKIYREAAELWRQLHGEPPPHGVDGAMVLKLVLNGLPDTPYDRLATPYLRPTTVTFPKQSRG